MLILSNIKKLYTGQSAEKDSIHHSMDLFIDKGKIQKIRPHDPQLPVGESHQIISCSSYMITPGLIDCHGHITVMGLSEAHMDQMNSQSGILYVEKILHTTLVDGGVTTMRDIGGATHFIKRMVDEGVLLGPRLKIAICMLSTTGGHADFRGPDRCHTDLSRLWPEAPGRPSSIVDNPWECRKRVREIASCGADLIKICTSPGVASPSDKLENRDFSGKEIEAICEEASARGLKVAAHAHSKLGIDMAIRYGVYDIQHISSMDEKLVESAYEKGCTVTPTSWIIYELLKAKGLSKFIQEKVKKVAETHQKAVEFAGKGGLKILAGTDPVLPGMHGKNYMEIISLVKDGLSPLTAWYGATGLAAREIGQDDTGTIEPGKRADLLICKKDVLDRPELFKEGAILEVMKDGNCYKGGIENLPVKTYSNSISHSLLKKESP